MEDEGRPPDVLASEEAEGRPSASLGRRMRRSKPQAGDIQEYLLQNDLPHGTHWHK